MTTAKDWDDKSEFEEYRDTCKAVRDLAGKGVLAVMLRDEPMQKAASIGLELLQLVAQIENRYSQLKQQRNVLEFDDLLARTQTLLTDENYSQIQRNLARSTQLLMVDEFQDTDPLQVAIVKALRGEDWADQGLFVVGDFKQSIYRFRGAEPRVSSELRATLPEESRLSLTTNFRSQPAILDFVNALFHDAFSESYEPLAAHRPQLTPTPSVEFLWSEPAASSPEDEANSRLTKAGRARLQEARYIARRLAQLIDEGTHLVAETDEQGNPSTRPLQLGDIVILFRTLGDVALYEEALREYGLDYYLAGGHAFYTQQEIHDVMHLLRAVASPLDDLSLAGVLRSPMFALTDESLFWLVELGGSLNAGLFADELPEELSAAERAKVVRAASTLSELRQQKDQLLVAELLSHAIAVTGYDATLQTEFMGTRKWANVQKLIEQARTLDRTRPGDLHGFVTQLSEFVVRAPKEPLAATRAEGDVIRLMTIHYAKGLEFPLVVVPDLDRKGKSSDRNPVFDLQLGPLVPAEDKRDIVGWDLHRFVEQEQELEERKRLLYVACTRAADYLILSSSVEDLHQPKTDWMKFLGENFDLVTGAALKQLPSGYRLPEIRVIASEPKTDRKPEGPSRGADLQKLIAEAHQLAEAGRGVVPDEVAPIAADSRARKRFSFSRLTGELVVSRESRVASDEILKEPAAAESNEVDLDGRGLGSLVHAVLERLDFSQPVDDLLGLCEYLAPSYFEDEWNTAAVEASELVGTFLKSSRCAALAAARSVHREIEFILPWPVGQPSAEGRYLQGYIDCLYEDAEGGWHVLDYKSNRVPAAGVGELAKTYDLQMFVYHLACEQAIGVAPVESVLHFLRPGEEVRCTWNPSQIASMSEQVQQAIESVLNKPEPR